METVWYEIFRNEMKIHPILISHRKQREKCRSKLWHKIYGLTRSFAVISIKISLLPQLSFSGKNCQLRFSNFLKKFRVARELKMEPWQNFE